MRAALSYFQIPSSGYYQITNGPSYILGASTGYDFNKYITIDAGYSHAFVKNQTINIRSAKNMINGVTAGLRNAYSLKLTVNII